MTKKEYHLLGAPITGKKYVSQVGYQDVDFVGPRRLGRDLSCCQAIQQHARYLLVAQRQLMQFVPRHIFISSATDIFGLRSPLLWLCGAAAWSIYLLPRTRADELVVDLRVYKENRRHFGRRLLEWSIEGLEQMTMAERAMSTSPDFLMWMLRTVNAVDKARDWRYVSLRQFSAIRVKQRLARTRCFRYSFIGRESSYICWQWPKRSTNTNCYIMSYSNVVTSSSDVVEVIFGASVTDLGTTGEFGYWFRLLKSGLGTWFLLNCWERRSISCWIVSSASNVQPKSAS